jgi:hypothetical protein
MDTIPQWITTHTFRGIIGKNNKCALKFEKVLIFRDKTFFERVLIIRDGGSISFFIYKLPCYIMLSEN